MMAHRTCGLQATSLEPYDDTVMSCQPEALKLVQVGTRLEECTPTGLVAILSTRQDGGHHAIAVR